MKNITMNFSPREQRILRAALDMYCSDAEEHVELLDEQEDPTEAGEATANLVIARDLVEDLELHLLETLGVSL